jgi:DNA primase
MVKETELIKNKLDIVEFLRSYFTLSPAVINFKALCPFHHEKTPSLIVSPERKIWHCFGCGEGGDVIKFVMKYDNLEFPEALRFLAEKAGIPLQHLNPAQQKEFGVLYDIHVVATDFFEKQLSKNEKALTYLEKRKLKNDTIKEFRLGYAPGGESLTLHLLKHGFDINEISKSGLTYKNNRGLFRDRFEDRIIFPIHNTVEKVVAFTGRYVGDREDAPKYLNSPETPIFNKSRVLYGFHKSKHEIARLNSAFLVEGQMDFLMSWQSGIQNGIAVSGTGLTRDHLEKIRRTAETIIVSFDNDSAGLRALERSFEIFSEFDFHMKAIQLGEFKDPAEACEKNPEFLSGAIKNAKPAFSYLLDHYFNEDEEKKHADVAYVKRVTRHLLEKITKLKSEIEQNIFLKELAKIAGTREDILNAELQEIKKKEEKEKEEEKPSSKKETNISSRTNLITDRLFALAFTNEEFWGIVNTEKELFAREYVAILDDQNSEKALFLKMRGSYEFSDTSPAILKKEFFDLLSQLRLENLRQQQLEIQKKLKLAEKKNDDENIKNYLKEFDAIVKKIHEIKLKL